MTPTSNGPMLIVNADDFGYFDCVSRGILKAAADGIVTATGVLANAHRFAEHIAWLKAEDRLDVGVHLNLTEGLPLAGAMRCKLSQDGGRFPRKFAMAAAILRRKISADDVRAEWRAQIERCLEAGLEVRFLNSHEHLHMLPTLFPVAQSLAGEFAIPHVRFPTSRITIGLPGPSLVRDAIMKALATFNRRHTSTPAAHFIGMEVSGRITPGYLERTIPRLRPGQVYELMCHPGELDAAEVRDPDLRRYHDWEGELGALTSPAFRETLHRHGINLIGYRDIVVRDNCLVAAAGMA